MELFALDARMDTFYPLELASLLALSELLMQEISAYNVLMDAKAAIVLLIAKYAILDYFCSSVVVDLCALLEHFCFLVHCALLVTNLVQHVLALQTPVYHAIML